MVNLLILCYNATNKTLRIGDISKMAKGYNHTQRGKSAKAIEKHNERTGCKNKDVDKNRTKDNYNLIEPPVSYEKTINKLIKENYNVRKNDGSLKKIRSDACKVCETLFTASPDFFQSLSPTMERNFFEDCLKFAREQFGEKNIISATVHKDEATPHLHIVFVPLIEKTRQKVVTKKSKNNDRELLEVKECYLSADELLGSKTAFKERQNALEEQVFKKYKLEARELAEDTNRNHITINEFKKITKERPKVEIKRDLDDSFTM